MTTDRNEQIPQPTDRLEDGKAGIDNDPNLDSDTEGHSMLTIELARTVGQERAREMAKAGRDGARAREAHSKDSGGFFKRFGRR